ncbi:MAG TPA: mitochondrial fission ELM1 family protein [Geminicoccaceae bacterium]|nr:mitochondrial fission ELM1 family protein [Geminicoccaceae bacterium]
MTVPPRTWLMLGQKAGDNTQILALAEALGWPFEQKHLVYRRTELATNLFAGPTLMGLVKERSSPLEPPWPELVISAGRRNEPLVRWIQREAGGRGRVRLVHVGRPWARHECFDLIVTTPQYRLPEKPNILHNEAPLHRVTPERLAEAAALWGPRLAHLPRPLIAVVLGGNAGPYNFDRENGALLGWHASRMAAARGGSLLVTTSARTPAKAIDALEAALAVPAHVHHWSRGASENPYFAYLALAEQIVVTGDSMSMLAEACSTRKPVHIFDLARGPGSHRPPLPADGSVLPIRWWERWRDFRLQPIVYRVSIHTGPRRLTRDVGIIHRRQVAAGRAVWLGQPWPEGPPAPPRRDVERAVARVKALFA